MFFSLHTELYPTPKATELPPKRTHDHKISLVEGIPLVNMRPYMHPPIQKDVIEAMVKELLEAGVIKPSHIPFASPIVMVKKKDNTWRMCIDYRQLNKHTIKDKFPILVIDELIDERHRTVVFSKLNLSLSDHVQHLTMVLETMRQNRLFAKQSKCVFGTSHVEYLGHVISTQGVATNPSKIVAMQVCPILTNIKQLRGFLRLIGSYRKCIKDFASLSRHLTQLLKKNSYKWSKEAQSSFLALKTTMSMTL
ncbi:hypothetical protein Tco_1017366 [Tanacetum coccineum]|uniref:Uncharacterized protein n=1 Tax=Tanacetum coccineum TaxID=301880 RepID=A0ABQ5FRA1_9ASTR